MDSEGALERVQGCTVARMELHDNMYIYADVKSYNLHEWKLNKSQIEFQFEKFKSIISTAPVLQVD